MVGDSELVPGFFAKSRWGFFFAKWGLFFANFFDYTRIVYSEPSASDRSISRLYHRNRQKDLE